MIPESLTSGIEEMKDTEDKQLLNLIKDGGSPFTRKFDGFAVKVEEDKQIEYKDWEGNERTLKVPAGSYIVTDRDCRYPKIITADDFEAKNDLIVEKKEAPKKSKGPKVGIELMAEDY